MKDSTHKEAVDLLDIVLKTNDKDAKFKAAVLLMKYTFNTQKQLLVAIRDAVKNKDSLNTEEVTAIKHSIESLISGVNRISKLYDKMLSNEYKVN